MEIKKLSTKYCVRNLNKKDIDIILHLCSRNTLFYQHHPPFVIKERILEDMEALPPNKDYEDKAYIGFFDQTDLVAVMDLIFDYPKEKVAYIGFFMMDIRYQGKGLGTEMISDCCRCLSELGFRKIRLAVDKGNPQSNAFWTKNQFVKTGEEVPNDFSAYLPMERILP